MRNEDAISEFIQLKACIEQLLITLEALHDNNFDLSADKIDWSHVKQVAAVKQELESALELVGLDATELYEITLYQQVK